jgi:O-antigen/teichoic acid export membrane protein
VSNNKCIAKNTLALYFRQAIGLLIGLYTTRVILDTLGVEDYGLYNVIAGVVGLFSFFSGTMSGASQRYLSFELGRKDFNQLKRIFGLNLIIYGLIGIIILLLAETAGLWFVNNKLTIPAGRLNAVLWIYQFSILSCMASVLLTPYRAAIVSHEDMKVYSFISIFEALMKLGIVIILQYLSIDKLQLYGILMFAVTFINMSIYIVYCRKKYNECLFYLYWNKDLFKEITSYTSWNLFGTFVSIFKNQAMNILLNQFFNPVVVTARGIALSVSGCVANFSHNFTIALNPQIVKTYAAKQHMEMLSLVFQGSKATFFLFYLITLPALLEMPIILSIWLRNVPEYAVVFTRLALLDILVEIISYPIGTMAGATGKIKLYQSIPGIVLLLNLPVSWIALCWGNPPHSVMIIAVGLSCMAVIFRFFLIKKLIAFSMLQFMKEVILPLFGMSILSAVIVLSVQYILNQSVLRLYLITLASIFSSCGSMYLLGLTSAEKKKLKVIIITKLLR